MLIRKTFIGTLLPSQLKYINTFSTIPMLGTILQDDEIIISAPTARDYKCQVCVSTGVWKGYMAL